MMMETHSAVVGSGGGSLVDCCLAANKEIVIELKLTAKRPRGRPRSRYITSIGRRKTTVTTLRLERWEITPSKIEMDPEWASQ